MDKLFLLILFLTLPFIGILAQNGVHSSGGEAIGNGSVSYSIGQVVTITSYSQSDQSTAFQGVQIPYEELDIFFCPGDFNNDGFVNVGDIGGFLGEFGCTLPDICAGDYNEDGNTNVGDIGGFLGTFGSECQ